MVAAQYDVQVDVEIESNGLMTPTEEEQRIAGAIRTALDGDYDKVTVTVKEVQRWSSK
jgi:hypothetical protein